MAAYNLHADLLHLVITDQPIKLLDKLTQYNADINYTTYYELMQCAAKHGRMWCIDLCYEYSNYDTIWLKVALLSAIEAVRLDSIEHIVQLNQSVLHKVYKNGQLLAGWAVANIYNPRFFIILAAYKVDFSNIHIMHCDQILLALTFAAMRPDTYCLFTLLASGATMYEPAYDNDSDAIKAAKYRLSITTEDMLTSTRREIEIYKQTVTQQIITKHGLDIIREGSYLNLLPRELYTFYLLPYLGAPPLL